MRNQIKSSSSPFKRIEGKLGIKKCVKKTVKPKLLKPTLSLGRTKEEHFRRIASLTPNSKRILSHLKIVPINISIADDSIITPTPIKVKPEKRDSSGFRSAVLTKGSFEESLDYKTGLVHRKVKDLKAVKAKQQQQQRNHHPDDYSIKHSTAVNIKENDLSYNQSVDRTRKRFGRYDSKENFKDSPVSYIRHSETPTELSINSIYENPDLLRVFKKSPSSYAIDPVFTTSIDSVYAKALVSLKSEPKVIKKSPIPFNEQTTIESIHGISSLPFISIPNISTDLSIESIRDRHQVINISNSSKSSTVSYVLKQTKTSDSAIHNNSQSRTLNSLTSDTITDENTPLVHSSPLTLNLKLSKYLSSNSATSSNTSFNLNDLSIKSIAHHSPKVSNYATHIPSPLTINHHHSTNIRNSATNHRSTPIGFMTDLSIESIHNKSSPGRSPKPTNIRQYQRRVPTKPLANRMLTTLKVSTSTPNKSPRRPKSIWTVTPTKDGLDQSSEGRKPNATPIRKLLGRINRPWIQTPPRIPSMKVKSLQSLQVS